MLYCKGVHRKFTRMFTELKGKYYYDRLRNLNLWTLEERRNRQDLIEVFKGFTKMYITELFTEDSNVKGIY